MSRSTLRAAIPDLFDYVPAGPIRRAEPARARVPASLPELSTLPDLRLARLLIEVSRELKQRTRGKRDSASQTEFDLALQEAARTLEALLPKQEKRAKRSRAADTTVPLQEAKRKAIRTALQAGVSPGQVANHFGVPLSAVREALGRAK